MKFFIASDLHGSLGQTEKIIAAFEKEKADMLLLGGDHLYHGPRNSLPGGYAPDKAAVLLNSYAGKILAVRGNCDSEVDQIVLDFPMMGDYVLLFAHGRRCFLTHGHIYSPEAATRQGNPCPRLPAGSVFISGHTHIPVLEISGGIVLINPGSPSIPKGGSAPGYALLTGESAVLKTLDGETLKEIHFGRDS
jgi:putative phosphoesterase